MKTPVVSNASPIIALQQIGQLGLLHRLFDRILIPPAVVREVEPTVLISYLSGLRNTASNSHWALAY